MLSIGCSVKIILLIDDACEDDYYNRTQEHNHCDRDRVLVVVGLQRRIQS